MELPPPPSPPPSAPPSSPPATDTVPLGHTPFSWRADASVAPPSRRRRRCADHTSESGAALAGCTRLSAVRFCALLSYDGTDFDGWMGGDQPPAGAGGGSARSSATASRSSRPGGPTPASTHARRSSTLTRARPPRTAAARAAPRTARRGDRLRALARAPSGFHSRQSCVGKRYTYRVLVGGAPAPRSGARPLLGARIRRRTDARGGGLAARLARLLGVWLHRRVGQVGADPRGPVRELRRLDVLEEQTAGQQRLLLVIEADRFLMRMARMIIGTLVEVGCGRLSVADFGALLGAARRTPAVVTAPAAGLSLDAVFYSTITPSASSATPRAPAAARRRRARFPAGLRST